MDKKLLIGGLILLSIVVLLFYWFSPKDKFEFTNASWEIHPITKELMCNAF